MGLVTPYCLVPLFTSFNCYVYCNTNGMKSVASIIRDGEQKKNDGRLAS